MITSWGLSRINQPNNFASISWSWFSITSIFSSGISRNPVAFSISNSKAIKAYSNKFIFSITADSKISFSNCLWFGSSLYFFDCKICKTSWINSTFWDKIFSTFSFDFVNNFSLFSIEDNLYSSISKPQIFTNKVSFILVSLS